MARDKKGSVPTGRRATVRVKTARGRTVSSQRWLQRQLNDPYVEEAKKAKEAFITSATSFVTPVVKIDGDKVGAGKVGATARRLREEYVRFSEAGEAVT